jgi:hypothetical protein
VGQALQQVADIGEGVDLVPVATRGDAEEDGGGAGALGAAGEQPVLADGPWRNVMGARKPTLLDFNRAIQEIAEGLYSVVEAKLGTAAAWDKGVLDVRSPADDETQIAKFRIRLSAGTTASARLTGTINALIRDLWRLKRSAFAQTWHGLTLTLTPKGDCKTEFNYDKACFDDVTFFET